MTNLNISIANVTSEDVLKASFNTDIHLLNNRKGLELNKVSSDAFISRGQKAAIERKYKVVIEALEGLYKLRIQHTCSLIDLINSFESI